MFELFVNIFVLRRENKNFNELTASVSKHPLISSLKALAVASLNFIYFLGNFLIKIFESDFIVVS